MRVSDEELLRCLEEIPAGRGRVIQIAAELGISRWTVTERIKRLRGAGVLPAAGGGRDRTQTTYRTHGADRSFGPAGRDPVFDIASNLQRVHEDLRVLVSECQSVGEKNAVYGKILDALKFAEGSLKTLYSVQEIQGFMEEVLGVLESFEPGSRRRVLQALQRRRALRSAAVQSSVEE